MLLKRQKVKDYNAVVKEINHFQQKHKITVWTGLHVRSLAFFMKAADMFRNTSFRVCMSTHVY